jgi:hypothetical protein
MVAVELLRDPITLDVTLEYPKDICRVFGPWKTKEDFSRSIINRHQETTLASSAFKPVVKTTVELQQCPISFTSGTFLTVESSSPGSVPESSLFEPSAECIRVDRDVMALG